MNLKVSDARREEGFTLIELLVVVIIIGILAAIAIPLFLNQRQRAWQGSAESDARNAAIEVETLATRAGNYPTNADMESSQANGVTNEAGLVEMFASDGVAVYYARGAGTIDGDGVLTIDTADETSFVLCADHAQIDDDTSGLPDESAMYLSNLGGLQDWNTAEGCPTTDPAMVLVAINRPTA